MRLVEKEIYASDVNEWNTGQVMYPDGYYETVDSDEVQVVLC